MNLKTVKNGLLSISISVLLIACGGDNDETDSGTPDTIKPIITLSGSNRINLTIGDSYTDAGATATDNEDGNITANINKTGAVNTSTAGTYTIKYNISDAANNKADEVIRTVIVKPNTPAPDTTKPVILLLGSNRINLTIGDSYTDAGATATDNKDGNITARINKNGSVNTSTAGTYTIKYNVSDAANNKANEVIRTVIVKPSTPAPDTTKPVITLVGSSTINLTVGDIYTDAGATATDNKDGNITARIHKTGTVKTSTAGTYTIKYNVSDVASNKANEVIRTVIVTKEVIQPNTWYNKSFPQKTGVISAVFTAKPLENNIDTVIGFSKDEANAYSNLATIVRFSTNGKIDARNGSNYEALKEITYQVNKNYTIRLIMDLDNHVYDIYVKPEGEAEALLGYGFSFRSEQSNLSIINNMAHYSEATASIVVSEAVLSTATRDTPKQEGLEYFNIEGDVVASDTAKADNAKELWGEIKCQDDGKDGRYTFAQSKGDTHLKSDGEPQGNTSYRSLHVKDGDDNYGERCEIGKNNYSNTFATYEEGDRSVTMMSIKLGDDYPLDSDKWQLVMQMKQTMITRNDGPPMISLHAKDGKWMFKLSRSRDYTDYADTVWEAPAEKGKWTRFAFDITYSQNSDIGKIKIYADLNGDGDALDENEQSEVIEKATLKREIAVCPNLDDCNNFPEDRLLVKTGESVPSHLSVGAYHNRDLGSATVGIDNVQVIKVP